MEWSIQDVARAAGTTSRTLRHYDAIGILEPTRIGANGYRYYDDDSLVRLQRIMLLRELDLDLPTIAEVLDGQLDAIEALREHVLLLEKERDRIEQLIATVSRTLRKMEGGERLVAQEVFDGFDHTQYKDEVIERWGRDAYERGDRWWRSLSAEEKQQFQQQQLDIATAFADALSAGKTPDSEDAQAIVQRHYDWLSITMPNPSKEYIIGLGQMYVDDPRFTKNYDKHGEGTAVFVRDAMKVYAERNL